MKTHLIVINFGLLLKVFRHTQDMVEWKKRETLTLGDKKNLNNVDENRFVSQFFEQ